MNDKPPVTNDRLIMRWVFALCLLLLLPKTFSMASAAYRRVVCPVQVQQEEAILANSALLVLDGKTPYQDLKGEGPFWACNYPPLFFALQAFLIRSGMGLFSSGRWISLVSFGLILALLIYWGRRRWSFPWTFLVPIWLMSSVTWWTWASMDRCDALMIAMNFSALTVYIFALETSKHRTGMFSHGALFSGFLHAIALMTKQTAWPLGLILVGVFFWERRWKDLLAFALGAYVPTAIVFGAFQLLTQGHFFRHTVIGAVGVFDPTLFKSLFCTRWALECGALFLMALGVLRWGHRQSRVVLFLFVFHALNLVSMGRVYAAENYYLEFFLLATVLVAEGLGRGSGASGPVGRIVPLGILAVSLSLFSMSGPPTVPTPGEIEAKRQAASLLKGEGPVLCIDADLALMTGRRIWYHPCNYAFFYQTGQWDPARLTRSLDRGEVEWVEIYDVDSHPYQYPPLMTAIRENYTPVYKAWGRVFLRPKTSQAKRGDKRGSALPAARTR